MKKINTKMMLILAVTLASTSLSLKTRLDPMAVQREKIIDAGS